MRPASRCKLSGHTRNMIALVRRWWTGQMATVVKAAAQSVYEIGFSSLGGFAQRLSRSTVQQWFLKFGQSAYLHGPVHRVAQDVALVQWHLYSRMDGEVGPSGPPRKEVYDHPLLELWDQPVPRSDSHPGFTGSQWRYLIQLYLELAGESFLVVIERDGMPTALLPIPPHWVTQTPSTDAPWYTISTPNTLAPEPIPAAQVIWLKRLDPSNPYGRGLGIAGTVDDEVSQLEWMNKFNDALFRNGSHPGAIIGVEGLDDKNEKRIRSQWSEKQEGFANAWRTAFIGGKVTMHQTGRSHLDLDFNAGVRLKRDTVAQAWCVPPEILGIVENSNRATAQAADYIHQSKNTLPRLVYQAEVWNKYLVPRYLDRRLFLGYENPVRETDEQRLEKADRGLAGGAITVNEWRREMGYDPLPDTQGSVLYRPLNVEAVDSRTGRVLNEPDHSADSPRPKPEPGGQEKLLRLVGARRKAS